MADSVSEGMKTFLIIVLSGALAAAAYATRPTEQQLQDFLEGMSRADRRAVKLSLPWHDRFLWVEVRSKEHLVFVGAFGHFFTKWDVAGRSDESALVRLP